MPLALRDIRFPKQPIPRMLRLIFVAGRRYNAWRDLDQWSERDIDRHAARFRSGVDVWIVQTYLQVRDALAKAGWAVALSDRFEPGAICVAHSDELQRIRWQAPRAYLIGVRADRPPLLVADKVILQNALQPESASTANIPQWPQPGLTPRDPARGNTVRRVGYFGRLALAPAFFFEPDFMRELTSLGLAFVPSERDWQDYRDIDIVLAFRTDPPSLLAQKPATKLTNAWLAGVPAVVGPEPAYLQLRRHPDDMCVARTAAEVIGELRKLATDPARYESMRARAASRAPEFDVERVRERWLAFFIERVAPSFAQWRRTEASTLARQVWYWRSLARQRVETRRFRARCRAEAANQGRASGALPRATPPVRTVTVGPADGRDTD